MAENKEDWSPINYSEFHNDYEVSTKGNIRSLHSKNYKNLVYQYDNKVTGYLTVTLHNNGYVKTLPVHRLVALTFVPNNDPDTLIMVNHKDEDKHNNNADNLEWCTAKYNANYGTVNDRIRDSRLNKDDKVKVPIMLSKGKDIKEFNSMRSAARFLGVTHGTASLRLNYPKDFSDIIKGWKIQYKDSNRTSNISYDKGVNHGKSNPNHKKSLTEVNKLISEKRPNLILLSGFTTTKDKANFKCLTCGNEFSMEPYAIYYQNYNCPVCSHKASAEKRSLSKKDAQDRLDKLFNSNILLGADYKNAGTPCKMTCNNCGRTVIKSPIELFSNGDKPSYTGNGCEHCAKSRNITIRNLKRYGHTDKEILESLHKKGLDWNLNI